MEGHFNFQRKYMTYPSILNSKLSQELYQLRDFNVSTNRIFLLSKYVEQLKNKNNVFPFTTKTYEYIINPENSSISVGLLQFVQNSSFFLSYLQETPDVLSNLIFTIKRQSQYIYMINCIVPSFFGYFSCQEYVDYAIDFYSEIFKKTSPLNSIQIVQPFFRSCITYHFFDNAYGSFFHALFVDENIIKNPDKQLIVYSSLFVDCITKSMKFLPKEFFKLINIIEKCKWDFRFKKILIIDSFLLPELKQWITRLCLSGYLADFLEKIINLISSTANVTFDELDYIENNFCSLSSSMNFIDMMNNVYRESSSSNLHFDGLSPNTATPPRPTMTTSKSTSTLRTLSKCRSPIKLTKETRSSVLMMMNLINSFFIRDNQSAFVYELPLAYQSYVDDMFPQCAHFSLSVYDIRYVAKILEKNHMFPNKIASVVFLNDSIEMYENSIFFCHAYSHHIPKNPFKGSFSLFGKDSEVDALKGKKEISLNLSLINNDLFLDFLKVNQHYSDIFKASLVETEKHLINAQTACIEKYITYSTLMDGVRSESDRLLYQSSFFLRPFIDQIVSEIKAQPTTYKNISFMKLFQKTSSVFNAVKTNQNYKNLYLSLLDVFYRDMIGHYLHVLLDFEKFWEELVNKPTEKKNLYNIFSNIRANYQTIFMDAIMFLSHTSEKSLLSKFYIMLISFKLLNHVAKNARNPLDIYEAAFQNIKGTEWVSTLLIIDALAMKVDAFNKFLTKEEIQCWSAVKKNIEIFLDKNEQYKQVYTSITEYLIAISPGLLYNTCE